MATHAAFDGLNISVFTTPLLESLASSLKERGANVLCLQAESLRSRSLSGWISDIIAGDYDDVIFSTAHGVRLASEYAAELGKKSSFANGLQATRVIALGRRTVRALGEIGLTADLAWTPVAGTGMEIFVRGGRFASRVVGVQSGSGEAQLLQLAVEAAGARVRLLSPDSKEDGDLSLLETLLGASSDVVVFGSVGQVETVLSAAKSSERLADLDSTLQNAVVVCPEAAANILSERKIHARTIPGRRLSTNQVEPLLASMRRRRPAAGGSAATTKSRIVVIGNGMVGHRFCERLVDRGADAFEITVIGEEPRAAYDRVHLTNYFSSRNADDLALARPEWHAEQNIQLLLGERAVCIRRDERLVETSSGACLPYDHLVLATGSSPFVPAVPGVDREGVFVYRTIEDLEAITAYSARAKTAAVIGGGLLGLEAAKALLDLGLVTHVVEVAQRLMPRQLDAAGATLLARKITDLGVRVHLGKALARIAGDQSVSALRFNDGSSLPVDLVVISAGIRPRDELARAANIAVHDRGGVVVDNALRTTDPNIFAIGECAAHGGVTYGLVAPGYDMADVLATTLTGADSTFEGGDLSAKLKLLGVDVASFGNPFADTTSARTVIFEDLVNGVYKKLVLDASGTRLIGGILVGDAAQYATVAHLARTGKALPVGPEALLVSTAGAPLLADDSIPVCSCNNVSRQTICETIRKSCLTNVNDVKKATRAGTGCGGCLPAVSDLLGAELRAAGRAGKSRLCEHFEFSRTELFEVIRAKRIRTFEQLLAEHGTGNGCEICKPTAASIFASVYNDDILQQDTLQDTNDRFLANVQRGGLYSVVPRVPGGEITPDKVITLGRVAQRFGLYMKITGGQRIDLFGARVNDLPEIWEELVRAGFESGHAYGKAMRTVKSCVGSTWCRYGVQDSVAFAIRVENRYKGVRAPHKLKSAVSGCIRECAEAQSKDFGLIATEKGYNLYVCGNGGAKPRHADLLASDLDEDTAIRYLDRFIMFYIRTADRLTRTSVWLEKMEGGIEHLRDVIVRDSLGICAYLEADMQNLVDTYRCEWTEVVNDPAKREKFRHFANSEQGDNTVSLVVERGQRRPTDWPRIAEGAASNENGPTEWVRVAPVSRFPRDGGMAVACRERQIAVFHFASRNAWYALDNRCPHKGDQVLARGIIGDQNGVPKVACPLHKKTFSLEDGRCLSDDGYAVSAYAVRVHEGWVYVEVPIAPPAFVPAERLLAKKAVSART